MLKLKFVIPLLFLTATCWARDYYLQPGAYAIVNNRQDRIICTGNTTPDPNPKWSCGCYLLNQRVAGVDLFAPNRERAEEKALPKCREIIPDTQLVDCQRM